MDISETTFIKEMCDVTANMYRQGWDERNGGNVSMLLSDDVAALLGGVIRKIPLGFEADDSLLGKLFLVTGTGKYFKNVSSDPETNLGIVRIRKSEAELLWGFRGGGKFTSEFPAHLMAHATRLKLDPLHRVVIHTHPQYTIAMNMVCDIDERSFTKKLWQTHTEAVVVFPDGVGVLPCMVGGTEEIALATAKKLEEYRLVVWSNHGIYGTGRTTDEAFGLIETVEKVAMIYMLTLGRAKNVIPDEIIRAHAKLWNCKLKDGIL